MGTLVLSHILESACFVFYQNLRYVELRYNVVVVQCTTKLEAYYMYVHIFECTSDVLVMRVGVGLQFPLDEPLMVVLATNIDVEIISHLWYLCKNERKFSTSEEY